MEHEAVRREYAALAPVYEKRWRRYVQTCSARALAALAPQPGERILDAGCGTGFLLERIAEAVPGAFLAGIDASPDMLDRARGHRTSRASLEQADVRHLPFSDGSFDAVVLASVLHYLPDAAIALREAARVLGKNGRIVVTDWCGDAPAMRVLVWALNRRGGAHVYLRRPRELRELLDDAGFVVTRAMLYRAGFPWRLNTLSAVKTGA